MSLLVRSVFCVGRGRRRCYRRDLCRGSFALTSRRIVYRGFGGGTREGEWRIYSIFFIVVVVVGKVCCFLAPVAALMTGSGCGSGRADGAVAFVVVLSTLLGCGVKGS
jgi:hypothetical protein